MKKNLFLTHILLMLCVTVSLTSCSNDDMDSNSKADILDYDGFGEVVLEGSITPFSVTIDVINGGRPRTAYISENKDSLEIVMHNFDYYYPSYAKPECIKREDNEWSSYERYITFYGLKPNTQYYWFLTEDGYNPEDPRKISLIHSFVTEDMNIYCDLGGSVIWCGVNYLENRGIFDNSQFLKSSLFGYSELPNPSSESLEGNWRYPTRTEIQELCDNCKVTMIDFRNQFVRITSQNGENMYIPFTYRYSMQTQSWGRKNLMLFPCDGNNSFTYYGLCVYTPDISPLYNLSGYYIKFEEDLTDYELKIVTPSSTNVRDSNLSDFFCWSYIDATGTTEQRRHGDEKRGIRYVMDK